MYALERQRWIVDTARRAGRIEVADVASSLDVAVETVRRDLTTLERHGVLRRVHGGAVPVERLGFEGGIASRAASQRAEKERVAQAALRLLENVDSVYLDEGSSVAALAALLDPQRPLTVVTASLPVAVELAPRSMLTVIALGGRVRAPTMATTEHWAVRMLEDLVLDMAVLGTNGLTAAHGLTCPDAGVAAVKSRAVASARRSILLANSTKFGLDSSVRFASLNDLEAVVTDRATTEAQLRPLRRAGVEVVLA
jgi:DeoR family transcriptional regulator, fructose operon transcriptional repressor